jgi:hypothetical protein
MSILRRILSLANLFGIDPITAAGSLTRLPQFLGQRRTFQTMLSANDALSSDFPIGKLYPCFSDDRDASGSASGHYFHQDLLVARRIYQRNPQRHVDVGSRVDGFIAHVACFREIEVFDIRPLESKVRNLIFRQADLMSDLPDEFIGYCDSLSCLHTLEHFGLGRYGDPINPTGHLVGFHNLTAILADGGTFYLSVPIGRQRIEFNAHRVFGMAYLLKLFEPAFEVVACSIVDDEGNLSENVVLESTAVKNSFGCNYGCGIFELKKRQQG